MSLCLSQNEVNLISTNAFCLLLSELENSWLNLLSLQILRSWHCSYNWPRNITGLHDKYFFRKICALLNWRPATSLCTAIRNLLESYFLLLKEKQPLLCISELSTAVVLKQGQQNTMWWLGNTVHDLNRLRSMPNNLKGCSLWENKTPKALNRI